MHGLKISAILAACTSMVVGVPTHKHQDSCDDNQFWYGPKKVCLWNGYKDKYDPPPQHNCGKHWYWHKNLKYCVPPSPTYGDAGCDDGWKWDDDKYYCVPIPEPAPGPGQCGPSYFWWKTKSACLPYGGTPTPSYPPNGWQCPKKWYWHSGGHCAPPKPDYGSPDCDNIYVWDNDGLCCKPKRY
ncbi:unnamed protein product [Rhizoctonia solani]|uniref:Uncharacterized protein n=1 Tax=Rhizoctonia solani TaxID=456999 RepID=A0A8H3BEN1_9AGAM|nr:unnamed protein product [Rhizoctonia solani]